MRNPQENICKFVTESTTSALTATSFIFEKKDVNRGKRMVKQVHIMYLISSGSGFICSNGKSNELLPGTLAFSFADEEYEISGKDGFEYMYISFTGTKADELFLRFGINKANRVFGGFESLLPFWQTALAKANASNLDLISESVLLYSFSQMSETRGNSEQQLTGRIIALIEKCFSDNMLSLSSAAQNLGYNPKYMSRIFSKNVGITFSEYLKNTRIKHSLFLMENGVTSVKNIALLSGYSDPLYFSNVFKASVGASPSEYISKLQGNDADEN